MEYDALSIHDTALQLGLAVPALTEAGHRVITYDRRGVLG